MDTPVFTSVLLGTVVMGVKLFTAVDFPTLAKGAPNTDTFYSSELIELLNCQFGSSAEISALLVEISMSSRLSCPK